MHLLRRRPAGLAALTLLLFPALVSAAEEATAIVFVADSRGLAGWRAWFTNLYNESSWQFTLLTVTIIPLVGVVLGLIADFFMSKSGINLRSRAMGEH